MPDEQRIPDLRAEVRRIELEIVYLLTEGSQPLWTLEDLARELNEPEIINYTRPLHAAGLIHRTSDGHVFASRAAIHQVQLVGHGVI